MTPKKAMAWVMGVALSSGLAACGSTTSSPSAGATAQGGSTLKSGSTIQIGWIGGLTGLLAEEAQAAQHGTELAVQQINAHGGVLGHQVQVIYEDTGINPQKSIQAAQQLVLKDHVAGVLGDYFSPNTLAVAPLMDKYHVPLVTYDSTATALTHSGYTYYFQPNATSAAYGRAMAYYAVKVLHIKSFLIIGGTDAYSLANIDAFKTSALKLGASVVAVKRYAPGKTKDFTPYFLKYRGTKFGGFFLGGSPPDNALIVKQFRANGFTQPIFSLNGINRPIDWQEDGSAIVGATVGLDLPEPAANASKYLTPAGKAFLAAWKAHKYNILDSFDGAHAYDATMLLLKAIQKAGSTNGPAVRQALFSVGRDYVGAVGTLTFRSNGGVKLPQYIMQWQSNGTLKIVSVVPSQVIYP